MEVAYKETILAIITRYLPSARVYLFGSRARGDFSPTSDIDIAIDAGVILDRRILSSIKEDLEESLIPFTIDVVDLYAVSQEFKEQIIKDGVVWH